MGNKLTKEEARLRSERFVSTKSSDFKEANHNPIYGYQHLPVFKLEKAVQRLIDIVPGLMTYVVKAKEDCNRNSSRLTHDESAAIYLYSMPIPFFSKLNATLREKNRDAVKPWFGFLRLFLNAVEKLPSVNTVVWRGVSSDVGSDFVDGSTETWWSVNSCSTDLSVVQLYLGKTGTVFAIDVMHGKDISDYSVFKDEHEIILLPGASLYIKSKPLSYEGRLFIIHLEEQSAKSGRASNNASASNQNRVDNSKESSGSTAANYKEPVSPLHRSLDLSSIERKPLQSQSLRYIIGYSDLEIISSNDEVLLLYGDKHFFLLNEKFETISKTENSTVSSLKILDITWSSLLTRFIAITKTNLYVFDPITNKLSSVVNVQLRENEERFISCTCTNRSLFIVTAESYYPFYINHYTLPNFVFTCQYTVTDLIEAKISPKRPQVPDKKVSKCNRDSREISIVRSNRGRLALIMKIESKNYLYVINMTKTPFESAYTILPSTKCKLNRIALTGEWLLACDDYEKKIMQVSLDCEFTTEYDAKRKGCYDEVNAALVFGSSCIVAVRGTKLEMYHI